MSPLSILLLGGAGRAEFRDARASLGQWGVVREAGDVETAAAALAEGELSPDVIVVAQSRPGEFPHQAIDRLRRLAPLARILGLMGSWCEGEMRSGSPWSASARVYWHQWAARCGREFQRLADGEPSSWALPVTATEEERLLADVSSPCHRPHPSPLPAGEGTRQRRGVVVIRSRSSEMADWLLAACRGHGLAAVWQRRPAAARVEGATAAVFDAVELDDAERDELSRFAAAAQPSPTIALLAFPRIDDCRRALSAGAVAVLSKPVAMEDLFWQVDAASCRVVCGINYHRIGT